MESKKNPKVDLEKKRVLFLEIGFLIALSIVLFAFEMKQYEREAQDLSYNLGETVIKEEVIQTEQQRPETPPPPPQQITTLLTIVSDDEEGIEDIDFNFDVDPDAIVSSYEFNYEEEKEQEQREVFRIVEEVAEFPGGEAELFKYLGENVVYPTQAREAGIEGTVYIQFVVEADGSISNVVIQRDIGAGCGENAKAAVERMPRWKPAKQRKRPVASYFILPVEFKLAN